MKDGKKSLLIISLVLVLVLVFGVGIYYQIQDSIMEENKQRYQGPVPEGCDEEYFRETGITKPLEK